MSFNVPITYDMKKLDIAILNLELLDRLITEKKKNAVSMNWIKITPETIPAIDKSTLVINGLYCDKGRIRLLDDDYYFQSDAIRGQMIRFNYFTHYCIITNPEE